MTDEDDLVGQMMAAMRSNDPNVVLELYADDCQVADPAGRAALWILCREFWAAVGNSQ